MTCEAPHHPAAGGGRLARGNGVADGLTPPRDDGKLYTVRDPLAFY